MTTLIAPNQILTHENMTKVCLIGDINKINLLLCKRNLNAEEFDKLYDYSVDELHQIISNGQYAIQFQNQLEVLAKIFGHRERRDTGLEDGN
jgi:hypothetical protein